MLAKRTKRIPKGVPSLSVPNIEDVDDDKGQEEEEGQEGQAMCAWSHASRRLSLRLCRRPKLVG